MTPLEGCYDSHARRSDKASTKAKKLEGLEIVT
jgi:hypothetical protein